jgi:hypothetical protein
LERVQASYQRLTKVAANLNTASDNLGKVIALLDERLKKLNLGISAWHKYADYGDEAGNYRCSYLGYARVGNKWGIAISKTSGNHNSPPEYHKDEEWLFNDAPRNLRMEAVEHIPAMIETLISTAEQAVEKIKGRTDEAKQIAKVLTPPPKPPTEPEINLD